MGKQNNNIFIFKSNNEIIFSIISKEDIQALNTGEYGQQFVPVNAQTDNKS